MRKIVKNTTFVGLLDLLAPHSCMGCGHIGNALCERCKNHIITQRTNICPNCKAKIKSKSGNCKHCKDLPATFIVGERDELIGTLVHNLKYQSVRSLARPLAELLDASLPDFKSKAVIVPLPTISKHIRKRALDHTYLISRHLSRIRHYQVQRLLLRTNSTTQVGTDRATRQKQAASAYALNPKFIIDPQATYILLDDVWTTGASMLAATRLLKSAGASNIVISILALSRI